MRIPKRLIPLLWALVKLFGDRSLLLTSVLATTALQASAQSAPRQINGRWTFDVSPGVNTLISARDAARVWRARGHPDDMAVIRLLPGQYSLTQPLALNQLDSRLVFEARDPQKTVIGGGQRITGFTVDSSGVWHAKTPLHFEQLYVNGRRATRARWPAEGSFPMLGSHWDDLPNNRARYTIKVPNQAITALPNDPAALRNVRILILHKWDTSWYSLSGFQPGGTITFEGDRLYPGNPWYEQTRFVLENSKLMLKEPRSWFLDETGDLSYVPLPGQTPDTAEVVAPVIEKFVEIRGARDLAFNGLRFHCAGYQMPPGGCPPAQAAAAIEAAFQADGADNLRLENVEIAHTGNYAIWFRRGCQSGRIRHCLLTDLGAGGIRIGEGEIRPKPDQTGNIWVEDNIIHGCGRVHPCAVGIWIGQSANNRILHNDIADTFYTGISAGWTWGYGSSLATNNLIECNRIHKIGQGLLSDMGGIYTLGISTGSVEAGNVIFDVRAHDYGGWGIYPDEGSTGWRIESNLVWDCTCVSPHGGGAFHQHYGATNHVVNNIFALSSGPTMHATRVEDHISFILERNVIVSSNTPFFTGPWDKIRYESRSNCFVYLGPPQKLFPTGDLASWQKAGHEIGSIQTALDFHGNWPDVTLSRNSPASEIGFQTFDPKEAGVRGTRAWKGIAARLQ